MTLPDGLYNLLLTEQMLAGLDLQRADLAAFNGEQFELLLDVLARQLVSTLEDIGGEAPDLALRQVELVNALLALLRQRRQALQPNPAETVDLIAMPPQVLRSIQRDRQFPQAPEVSLAAPWLFTAGKGSPSLLQEIRKELASADRVDILVSFITVRGAQTARRAAADHGAQWRWRRGHAIAHPHHHLYRGDGSACPGRIGAAARLRGARLARRPSHALACQGLALPSPQWLRVGLRGWHHHSRASSCSRRTAHLHARLENH